ncbi:phosphatidate cytidylyltransferase [Cytobacillus gottheilii]|uniref:phosphatidate cytidylyltransferase n=1 Tax=Cytobacillus gottheilii TaxID=859144 RepID=UPI003CEAC33A
MKQRSISAVVFVAILLPIVIFGGLPLTVFTYIIATVGLHELLRMRNLHIWSIPGVLSTLLLWTILLPADYQYILTDWNSSRFDIIILFLFLFLSYTVVSKNKFHFDDAGFVILTVLYIGVGFHFFIETRFADNGLIFIFYSLFLMWATDSGAYLIGKAIGKRKLWPEISPNKTIEGSLGGVACAIIVAILFMIFTDMNLSPVQLIVMTIVLSIFGQVGDLAESAFKRHYKVKDSGKIMPGHGGVLDRFDSLLFVWPLIHLLHFI